VPLTKAEIQRRYKERHPERVKEIEKRYRQRNPEKMAAKSLRRRANGKASASCRSWRERNIEYAREYSRQRKLSFGPYYAARQRLRKHRLRCSSFEEIDLGGVAESQGFLCFYCLEPLSEYQIDHKIPVSRGGGHTRDNVCLACPRCNMSKKAKTSEEFLAYRAGGL